MIALLLAWGGKLLARPAILAGVIGAGALGGYAIYHHWKVDRPQQKQVAALTQETLMQRVTIANLGQSIAQERVNVKTLEAQVKGQNDAITQLQAEKRRVEQAASVSALRALERGRAEAEALRAPTTTVAPGAAALNEWLSGRLVTP